MRKALSLLLSAAALLVVTPPAVSADLKLDRPVAAAATSPARERQQVADAVRGLGFTVGAVVPAGDGAWDVQVERFDPARAQQAMRGVVRGAATQFALPGKAMAVREGIRGGGGIRPGAGGRADDGDGSQTGAGGGNGQQPDDPFGIDGQGGGDAGGENDGGGSATGAGQGGGEPEPSGGGRSRAGTLRVSVQADGVLRVDAASLRSLGLSVGRQQAGNLQVR